MIINTLIGLLFGISLLCGGTYLYRAITKSEKRREPFLVYMLAFAGLANILDMLT